MEEEESLTVSRGVVIALGVLGILLGVLLIVAGVGSFTTYSQLIDAATAYERQQYAKLFSFYLWTGIWDILIAAGFLIFGILCCYNSGSEDGVRPLSSCMKVGQVFATWVFGYYVFSFSLFGGADATQNAIAIIEMIIAVAAIILSVWSTSWAKKGYEWKGLGLGCSISVMVIGFIEFIKACISLPSFLTVTLGLAMLALGVLLTILICASRYDQYEYVEVETSKEEGHIQGRSDSSLTANKSISEGRLVLAVSNGKARELVGSERETFLSIEQMHKNQLMGDSQFEKKKEELSSGGTIVSLWGNKAEDYRALDKLYRGSLISEEQYTDKLIELLGGNVLLNAEKRKLLESLEDLRKLGFITQDQYQEKKKAILEGRETELGN